MSHIVNMLEAKTSLSELVRRIESGTESEIIIARSGRPAARLVALEPVVADRSRRIGAVRGRFDVPGPDPALDAEVQRLIEGSGGA
jgi:antitoxin (DNA-binding transcriptional repressor) of toxin-antitoxin stability system